MFLEATLIYVGVVGAIRALYEFRSVPLIGRYLSTLVALILIYPPVLHATFGKLSVSFFERNPRALLSSFLRFVVASLVIFPPFLGFNHLYQGIFFGKSFHLSFSHLSVELVLVQTFLVALPEEFFFRGYLQSLIARRVTRKVPLPGFLSCGWAVPIASALFALAHSLITVRWWHFAIFFPGLVFGWLREKTNGLVAPILFHAFSNILVAWINSSYR